MRSEDHPSDRTLSPTALAALAAAEILAGLGLLLALAFLLGWAADLAGAR